MLSVHVQSKLSQVLENLGTHGTSSCITLLVLRIAGTQWHPDHGLPRSCGVRSRRFQPFVWVLYHVLVEGLLVYVLVERQRGLKSNCDSVVCPQLRSAFSFWEVQAQGVREPSNY